jgi:serine/threonine protein kinase
VKLNAGDLLGRFEILGLVGAGGMGEVYRARDPELERDVAIKVLPGDLGRDPSRLSRFEREARAVGRLQHPNLLSIFDIGRDGETPYLVCELLEGETLQELLASRRPAQAEIVDVALQIARGLAAAHDAGIVHRDLKPSNLFITRDGLVKILDFGLAKLVTAPTDSSQSELPTGTLNTAYGAVLGTVDYMAPEQAAGREVDHRADHFSLGVVLYEMATSRRPFSGETPQETLSSILRDDPDPVATLAPDLPPPLSWIIERCLRRDPNDRYHSTKDLAVDLASVEDRSSDLVAWAPREPHGERKPRPGLLISLTVASLAIAASAILFAMLADRTGGRSTELDFQQITFRRGTVSSARFDPGGEAVLYSAAWEGGPDRIHLYRPQAPDSIAVGPSDSRLVSVSPNGELLLLSDLYSTGPFQTAGDLSRMPVTGGRRALSSSVSDAAFGPDGEVAAVVRETEGRAVLEFPVGTERLTTHGMIRELRLSPDGRRVAFANTPQRGHEWGPIEIFDRDGGHSRLEPEAGRGLAWSPSGDELWYVAKRNFNRLEAVTLEGESRTVATFPSEVYLFDIAPDGRVLLATEQRRYEAAGRLVDGTQRDLTWLGWSVPFDISADGHTILFNECTGQGVECRIALRGFDETAPVVLDRGGFGLSLSPDKEWVLSAPPWNPKELFLVATASEKRVRLGIEPLEKISMVSWAPDGDTLFVSGNTTGQLGRIFRFPLDGGKPLRVTPEGIAFGFFAVSPDSTEIAAPTLDGRIAIYPIDGGPPTWIDFDEQPIRWSTDGQSIYTAPIGRTPATLHRVSVATGKRELIAELMPADPAGVVQVSPVSVTPDGEKAVYGFVRRLSELFIVEGLLDP